MGYDQCRKWVPRQFPLAVSALLAAICIWGSARVSWAQGEDDLERSPEGQRFIARWKANKAELIRINGSGTDAKLRADLLDMGKTDQSVRTKMFALPSAQQDALEPELERTDATLTEKLKQIVASHGWPTIALVGFDASKAAILILIHSPDHDFQRRLLPELQKLVEEKKIVGSDLATLVDKMLVAQGKPQRFGTQFAWKGDGPMVMDPVEDPAHLDQRREIYLLPPMDLYKRMLVEMYHRKVQ
jgi:hypothetical protein